MTQSFPADDPFGLRGKAAIVAGGGARGDGIGNGRAAAILLADAGAKVAVIDREAPLAARTVEMIAERGGTGLALAGDVTDEADCRRLVQATVDAYGRLDVLDNNVGIGGGGTVISEDEAAWDRIYKVNVKSMILLSKAAIPAMLNTGAGGAIVNVSSISAMRPSTLTPYTMSKGAVISLTKAMAVDHGPDGIRVNCIAPGPVYTPMVIGDRMSDETRERRRRASVLGIEGEGWDIGHAVVYLASARARYVTGHTLVVDGGVTLQGPARRPGPDDRGGI